VLLLAGDEFVRADRGAIDEMLPRRQVFRAEGLMDRYRALGLSVDTLFVDGTACPTALCHNSMCTLYTLGSVAES